MNLDVKINVSLQRLLKSWINFYIDTNIEFCYKKISGTWFLSPIVICYQRRAKCCHVVLQNLPFFWAYKGKTFSVFQRKKQR